MYNNHDTDQFNVYDNHSVESGFSERTSSQNGQGAFEKTYTSNDTTKKGHHDQEGETRFGSEQKTRETSRKFSVNVSPATIEHYLKGMKYPADKEALIEQARSNSAPEDVMNILDQFEGREYSGVVEVNKEIGKVEENYTSNTSQQKSHQNKQESSQKDRTHDDTRKDRHSQSAEPRSNAGSPSSQDRKGGATNVSPATIEHHLKGMKYPADKEALIEQARSNSAPEDVMNILDQFEEKEYSGVVEVNKEIGRVESNKK